ncbi:carbon-nitrogen hydrolase family protein [Acetobacter sp. TBRC 12305]|uniref:Carbon-nitrogen hydrolase family protein n=1 Tax=Acetobacter garciniae TaxID=2817435 RepID=A0A939KRU5_9PROT|nr:carbon-nitrogen hydrolase family protein [Acetobacter garciniae]MBO1326171.1 carbon-nitrogen hydrolase family protein [Acetobacter garciniae]MBX0345085.1 carbon-nitrogen hydrolase family protein [Acetobacter garciniae]
MEAARPISVAAAHAAPVWMQPSQSVEKAISLMEEAALHGASFIVFPESYLSGFPIWTALAAPIVTHDFFQTFAKVAIRADGPEIIAIREAASRLGLIVQMGFTEGTDMSVGCLWNSTLLIGDDGSVLNHHRKLVPTYYEKMVWTPGDGAGLRVVQTPIGRIGGLICGENTNPLARYALMAQGEQLHTACFPPVWPTRLPGDGAGYDIAEAIRIRCGAHSFEAKCFTIVASGVLDDAAINDVGRLSADAERALRETPRAVSMIIGPDGRMIGAPRSEEGLLYATINLDDCIEQKQFQDVVGYYNRFDVFRLQIDRERRQPLYFGEIPRFSPIGK